jgi:uncharacterized protein YndB with AHSA1/START domain
LAQLPHFRSTPRANGTQSITRWAAHISDNEEQTMQIFFSMDIKSDLETVFSWLANPEKAKVWMKSVSKTEILHAAPGMAGTTFREVVEETGGRIEMRGSITAYEPNRRISFHLESSANRLDVDYRIGKTGDLVRLTVISNVHWKFPINVMSIFIGGTIKRKIMEQSQEEFAALKALCENQRAPQQAKN